MKAEIGEFSVETRSPFWIGDLSDFDPPDPWSFVAQGTVLVSGTGMTFSEMFDFRCTTPRWLESNGWEALGPDGAVLSGRGLFILHRWEPHVLERRLREIIEVEGDDWAAIVRQISLHLFCEDE